MDESQAKQDELARLREDNARLQRLADVLMDRVEQTTSSANTPFGFFQINAALTEQVAQQQQALRDKQQTLQAIFKAAPVGLLLVDVEQVIRGANQCVAEMLGRPEPEVVGQSLGMVIDCGNALASGGQCGKTPKCSSCTWRRLLEETRRSGRATCEHLVTLPASTGGANREIWLSVKAEQVLIAEKPHMVLSLEDVSTKKLAERHLHEAKEAAEEASRLKSRFLSNVSHEIRTPLNGIIGFSEAILRCPTLDAARQQAQIILRESNILLMLVNDLLDLVKIESGKLVLEHVPVDLAQVLRDASQTAGMQARAKGLRFVAAMAVDVPGRILSDPLRLRQILLNLVSNAIKFTSRGEVRVSVELEAGEGLPRVRVEVRDTGIGVPTEKQQAIFERFTQADVSTTRQYGGTGLGLAIVRQLVQLLGGEVGLESVPGQGSTFWFTLPAEPAPEAQAQAAAPSVACSIPPRQGIILVAEDYPTNQEIVRLILEEAGHHVTIVSNGQEAVAACERRTFDLILMDLHMPVMDGQTAAGHIRQGATPNVAVPILALTASADAETRAACPRFGISGVLTKPIRREPLLAALQQWLAHAPTVASCPASSAATPQPAPQSATPAPPIDLDMAIREFGGRQVVARVAAQFFDHARQHLATLRSSVETLERRPLRQAAHALKGAAATLEAAPLARIAATLETASDAAERDALRILLNDLVTEFNRLRQHIDQALGHPEEAGHALSGDR
ncbi:MAG: response regulator [Phycisphaeraceae bacterium]|nr:response regulator [Phycisphaeraceae bacterium]